MTITLSYQSYEDLLHQETLECSLHPDLDDALDILYKFPQTLGQGYWREIKLRSGLELTIGNLQMRERIITANPEMDTPGIEYHFHVSGEHQSRDSAIGNGQYGVFGTGLEVKQPCECSGKYPYVELIIEMLPDTLYSMVSNTNGELPKELLPWLQPSGSRCYHRTATATPMMHTIAKQIMQCPYQGIAKRFYLEGKALELMGMLIAQEIEIGGGTRQSSPLKPDVVDRIYYARDILRQNLDNPPSLSQLARKVGLNECTLKRGFRTCFNTTVFGYLHSYRLEQAWQMLQAGNWKVGEVARIVGYRDFTAFGRAFYKKFGMRPRDCLKKYSA
jgi:AraC-like DNA-binding protein